MEQDLYKLKIDEEFRRFIPPLTATERKQLEENIIQDGCRDALCVWNKTIIDGHNRYEICTQHEIPFAVKYIFLRSRDEAIAWICANQLGRRNISEESRRYLIGKRYELEKIIGACNANGRNQHVKNEVVYQNDTQPAINTRERLGKEYKIGPATVGRYAVYTQAIDALSTLVPELHQKIITGQIKITQENLAKISRLSASEIRRIGEELLQNPFAQIDSVIKTAMPKNTPHRVQLAQMQIGAVKDMPKFDPDAEILSLALTVPSWVSSINRVRTSANISEISDEARKRITTALNEIVSAAGTMISAIEESK